MQKMRAVFFIVAALVALPTYAAQVSVDAGAGTYGTRDTFYVPIRIDTQGECINAVRVAIAYNPEEVTVRDIMTGDSLITLWTESPAVVRDNGKEVGRVMFEGGIPGGYCGRVEGDPGLTNALVRLVLRAQQAAPLNQGSIVTPLVVEPGSLVYRNDGSGDTVPLTTLGATITLVDATGTPRDVWREDLAADTIAPELFEVRLVRGPSEGNDHHYIVFSTTDKQSGIDHYEVLETDPNRFGLFSLLERPSYWVVAESPYVLRDQLLHSTIMVKAVDKVGNERIVEYTPTMSPLYAYTRASVLVPIVLALGIIGILAALIFRSVRRRALTTVSDSAASGEQQAHHEK